MSSSPGILRARENVDLLYFAMETAVALASVLGNVLVVLVVLGHRALRRDTTFCFVVSLAAALLAIAIDRYLRVRIPTR